MATDPVASTLPPGYAVEPPTVATLKATDVAATHELGPNGITPKSTLPEGYSIEGQQPPAPPQTPEQTLSDHNRYMVSAMTGQGKDFSQDPTLSPEERQQAEAGRKAGTIQGGVDIAAGAIGAAATHAIGAAASGVGRVGSAALKPLVEAIAEELPYLKSSPVLYLEHVAEQAVKYVIANPGKVITGSGVLGATAKYLLSKATP